MPLPDSSSLDTYLGADFLVNFSPVVDPNTDIDADGMNAVMCDAAMMTRTAMRGYVVFTYNGSTCTVNEHNAVWGNSFAVEPTVARSSTGVFVVTLPVTVQDELDADFSVNIKRFKAAHVEGTVAYHAQSSMTTANTGTIRIFDMAGAATDPTNKQVYVEFI